MKQLDPFDSQRIKDCKKRLEKIGVDFEQYSKVNVEKLMIITEGHELWHIGIMVESTKVIPVHLPKARRFRKNMRGNVQAQAEDGAYIKITLDDKGEFPYEAIATIICNGDSIGAVVIYGKDEKKFHGEVEKQLAVTAAHFLGKQMEN